MQWYYWFLILAGVDVLLRFVAAIQHSRELRVEETRNPKEIARLRRELAIWESEAVKMDREINKLKKLLKEYQKEDGMDKVIDGQRVVMGKTYELEQNIQK